MHDEIILDGEIDEHGRLTVTIPPDAPRGKVQVVLRKSAMTAAGSIPSGEDAALEALLNDPVTFTGLGLTAGEIAASPEFGAWSHRDDIEDGASYVDSVRRSRYSW